MLCRLLILLLISSLQLSAKTYYVSEDGLLVNKGTKESPLPFAYFEKRKNHAGDTFLVMDGVYPNHWITQIYGEKNRPVIVKSQHWLGADLVGVKSTRGNTRKILQIKGDYSWFVDFEIYEKEASNRIRNNGEEFYYSDGIHLYGRGGKVINCVAHDVLIGFSTWSSALEGEIYGCLAYNIGWNDLESSRKNKGHGHGYYVQNKEGQSTYKKLVLNIVWGTGSEGFHSYTQKGNIEYFHFENNLAYNLIGFNQTRSFGRGFILGGYQPVTGLKFVNNHLYKVSLQVGYGSNYPIISKEVSVEQNYLIESKINLYYLADMKSFANNFIMASDLLLTSVQDKNKTTNTWEWPFKDNKIYLTDRTNQLRVGIQELTVRGTRYVPLRESRWKDNSNEVSVKKPESKAFLYQNKYDSDRAFVYVYNFGGLDDFPVEMGKFLKQGDKFQIRDVENIHKVIYEGIYKEKPVYFPMNLTELARIAGNLPKEHAKHSDKGFNAFLVKKIN